MEYYRNFITIVEAGSISAAAKKISIAQPALSNQLKQLQRHYDAKLIEVKRGGHRMELTDAGRVLLRKARLICDEEANASKEISDCRAGFSGTLRFSLSPSMSPWLISRYLTKFNKLYPDVNYELHECPPAEQVGGTAVRQGGVLCDQWRPADVSASVQGDFQPQGTPHGLL